MSAAAVLPPKPQMRTAADPMVIRIIPELAEQIGLNESVLLLQIAFWIGSPNSGRFLDGQWWTWQSIRDMHEKAFPYLSISTINRAATKLIRDGYLIEGNYNERKYDKTRWFALNVEKIKTLKGVTVVESDKTLVHFEPRSNQNGTRSSQNEPRSTQDEPPIPEKSTKTSSKRSTKTDKTVVANPLPVAVESVEVLSVYVIPVLTDEDLFEANTNGVPALEKYQPMEAMAVVPVKSLPVEDFKAKPLPIVKLLHNDLTHDDRIIPGLKPGDPPLFKPDDVWIRVQALYEDVTGLPMSGKIQDDVEDGIKLRGGDAVLKLLEQARSAKTSRVGMVVKALENWQKDEKQKKHHRKEKEPGSDIVWNDDGSMGVYR